MPRIKRTVTETLDVPDDMLVDLDALLGEGYELVVQQADDDDDDPGDDLDHDEDEDEDEDGEAYSGEEDFGPDEDDD